MSLQKEISDWAKETFGEPTTKTLLQRLFLAEDPRHPDWELGEDYVEGELAELRNAIEDPRNGYQSIVEECADCLHLLFQISELCGYDLLEETRRKFEINKKRKWNVTGEGVGQHVDR